MTGNNTNGFTLIELVIAIAVIGLLAAIAYPNYTDYVRQAKRADCEAGLMQMASAMERDFSRTNAYRNITGAPVNFGNQCPIDGGTRTYTLGYQALTATTYTLQAVPFGPQTSDDCGTLTLTNTLQKGQSSGMLVADCW